MAQTSPPEPTMDEILASIRSIINDEEARLQEAGVTLPVEPKPQPIEPTPIETKPQDQDKALEMNDKTADEASTDQGAKSASKDSGSILGGSAADAAASAFSELTAAVKSSKSQPDLMMPAEGRTLEDVTKDLMRPMLKEWLDEHLAAIVREHVEEEVSRIARGRVR